jgi:hypothetical protein
MHSSLSFILYSLFEEINQSSNPEVNMFSLRKKSLRILVLAMLVFVIAVATYGFANANTIVGGTIYMGEGAGTISGYDVTVDYTVNLANPSVITAVDLTLNQNAAEASISFNSGGSWTACTGTAPTTTWTCSPSAQVDTANSITVYAAGADYAP